MTARLSNALRRLPPDQIEEVADFAEFLANRQPARSDKTERLKLDWVGMAADAYPEHRSGVEAAHATGEMVRKSLDRAQE